MKQNYIYILINEFWTTFYIGVTSNLNVMIEQHSNGKGSKFTTKYNIKHLVYFEEFRDINQAITREKQ